MISSHQLRIEEDQQNEDHFGPKLGLMFQTTNIIIPVQRVMVAILLVLLPEEKLNLIQAF